MVRDNSKESAVGMSSTVGNHGRFLNSVNLERCDNGHLFLVGLVRLQPTAYSSGIMVIFLNVRLIWGNK